MGNTYKQLYEWQKLNWVSMVETAIEIAGSGAELARLMGVSPSTVYQWKDGTGLPASKSREFIVKYLDDNGRTWTHTDPLEERNTMAKEVAKGMQSQADLLHSAIEVITEKFSTILLLGILNLAAVIASAIAIVHRLGGI